MHDAGHRAFAGKMGADRLWHWFIFTVCLGGSGSFWNNQHNKHHAATQELGHDIDLDTLPLVAFNEKIAVKGNRKILRLQHLTFLPAQLLLFFLWKFTHTRYMWRTSNYLELFGLALHHGFEVFVLWNAGITAILGMTFLGWSLGGLYLATIFSLNHTHKPVAEKFAPRDWVRRSAFYTSNTPPSWYATYISGYLNYQIEHHLFPSIPHPNLPKVAPRVQALFKKHNIPYDLKDMPTLFQLVFRNLYEVGNPEAKKQSAKSH